MEQGFTGQYTVVDSKFTNIITCRVYYTTKFKTASVCLWLPDNISSSASASGSGYNKQAAALQEAIKNAGFVTDKIRIECKNDPSSTLIELAKMVKYEGELHCLHAHT